MTDIFALLLKYFTNPSWRKLFTVFSVLVILLIAMLLYERYTSSVRLNRLQKAADLLVRLEEIKLHGTNNPPELQRAYGTLMAQTIETIEEKPLSLSYLLSKFTWSVDGLWKFAAGATLWVVLALFQLPKAATKPGKDRFLGLILLGVASGFVGMFVPQIGWPWFHLLLYPWLFLLAMIVAALPVAFFYVLNSGLKAASWKAKQITCISNLKQIGLNARMWADANGDVLPSKLASIMNDLPDRRVTRCPADDSSPYEIVSPGCSEKDPFVVYARCPIHGSELLVDGSVRLPDRNRSRPA